MNGFRVNDSRLKRRISTSKGGSRPGVNYPRYEDHVKQSLPEKFRGVEKRNTASRRLAVSQEFWILFDRSDDLKRSDIFPRNPLRRVWIVENLGWKNIEGKLRERWKIRGRIPVVPQFWRASAQLERVMRVISLSVSSWGISHRVFFPDYHQLSPRDFILPDTKDGLK